MCNSDIPTYFAVGEVIDLLADEAYIWFWFIECSTAGNVVVGFRQTNDGALQADIHRVCQCGMVCLRVIVQYLIHPALQGRHC